MEKERLALLKAEVEAQLAVIAEIYHKIDLRKKKQVPSRLRVWDTSCIIFIVPLKIFSA